VSSQTPEMYKGVCEDTDPGDVFWPLKKVFLKQFPAGESFLIIL
jgi:hypothetical protein